VDDQAIEDLFKNGGFKRDWLKVLLPLAVGGAAAAVLIWSVLRKKSDATKDKQG
jgi:hypothetical protein